MDPWTSWTPDSDFGGCFAVKRSPLKSAIQTSTQREDWDRRTRKRYSLNAGKLILSLPILSSTAPEADVPLE